MSNFPPNSEQQAVIDEARKGQTVILEALAGTGKTSTCEMVARALEDKRCLYAAFTKSTQEEFEAKGLPNVTSKTMHSLARSFNIKKYGRRFGPVKMSFNEIASILDIRGIDFDSEHGIPTNQMVGFVKRTVIRYCKSANETIEWFHVDMPEIPEQFAARKSEVRNYILGKAQAWWTNATDLVGKLQFFQDESLKTFQLSRPQLGFDVIFYDEGQDANPVILDIILNQNCQRIVVGDRNQQIYAWNGAVDALDQFDGVRLALTQSYRFGPAVADQANVYLTALESPHMVKGFDQIESSVTSITDLGTGRRSTPDCILSRTNGGCVAAALNLHEDGIKVAFAGGEKGIAKEIKSFAFAALKLMKGEKADHAALCIYANWSEVTKDVEDGNADDIAMMVRLINNYGPGTLIDICNASVNESAAQVVLSTAHKAKGREWDRVVIGPDFTPKTPEAIENGPTKADLQLFYVAVTRAKEILDAAGLSWFEAAAIDQAINEKAAA